MSNLAELIAQIEAAMEKANGKAHGFVEGDQPDVELVLLSVNSLPTLLAAAKRSVELGRLADAVVDDATWVYRGDDPYLNDLKNAIDAMAVALKEPRP